ncbi:hypothetical protein [Streptomyces tagetis]|uniref:Uncharacterized protein n=1 Tax=Streptomyces tagetis TaxID=2820809 RepID=A0A940XHZ2_9ACTN|nr:hypothetical protein [Streptomyces sp. RG38]MBQ0828754.1 hypothetical protein [Streptomyces sp. RG38]
MTVYAGVMGALVALLIGVSGVAALTRGWLLPVNRRSVRRVRLHGWGQLVMALGLGWNAACALTLDRLAAYDGLMREWGTFGGIALILGGLVLVMLSQLPRRERRGGGTPVV